MARSWQISLFMGIVTLILGIIVAVHPTGSLNVIAVLLGILLIISGIFHLIRVFDPAEPHRIWLGFAGLLFIVAGVILIRHLDLTRAIIGLFIGITWIVQGVAALIAGIGGGSHEGRGWWIAFGVISVIAGIGVSLLAIGLARRAPTRRRPAGHPRATAYAALINLAVLLAVVAIVAVGAAGRLVTGAGHVHGLPVLVASGTAALVMLGGGLI